MQRGGRGDPEITAAALHRWIASLTLAMTPLASIEPTIAAAFGRSSAGAARALNGLAQQRVQASAGRRAEHVDDED